MLRVGDLLFTISDDLIKKVNAMPSKPGIYKMMDDSGNIMYIGKSKSLKSRIKSYFSSQEKSNKIDRMMFNIHDIEYIVTDTHLEARILECCLIKKIKPIYNSQLKNDQNYRYLKVDSYNKHKPLRVIAEREEKDCFGPFRNKKVLFEIEKLFQNIYPIKKDSSTYAFTYNVLPKPMDVRTFDDNKLCLLEILSYEECMIQFIKELYKKMMLASSEYQFETASVYRDILDSVNYLHKVIVFESKELKSESILMYEKIEGGFKLFYIYNNRIILKRKFREISIVDLQGFIKDAKYFEMKLSRNKSEKSQLDFSSILAAEIQNTATQKTIIRLDEEQDLNVLIGEITNI